MAVISQILLVSIYTFRWRQKAIIDRHFSQGRYAQLHD